MKKILLTLVTLLGVYAVHAQCNTSFVVTNVNGLSVDVTNNSQVSLVPGSTPMTWYTWGDNTFTTSNYMPGTVTSHTYSNSGTYQITLHTFYFDSVNSVIICDDTVSQFVTVNGTPSPCASTISYVNNGGGNYTFTATNTGGGTGVAYLWLFGDGTSASGSPMSHTYANSGVYTVSLVTTASGVSCTTTVQIAYFSGSLNCSQLNASFAYNITSGSTFHFTNTSTPVNVPAPIYISSSWSFGDGNTSTQYNPTHTYASAGSYTVTLISQWIDSSNNTVYCTDTTSQTVTASTPPNLISGNITWDSSNNVWQTSFKVWLITFDSTTNIINAVDSTIVSGAMFQVSYTFNNVPSGEYRVKAAVVNGFPGATTLIPSYHLSSSYWGTANLVNHTGTSSLNKHIHLAAGTPAPGPGFISGNVTQGAGKGTGAGVPNLLVLLRDDNNQMVDFTYTDANGNYSFHQLAYGTYDVYPEHMPQVTTPSAPITIISGSTSTSGIDFEKTSTTIKPIGTGVANLPAADIFSIYPNPTEGMANLNWNSNVTGTVNIKVMDMTGRAVYNASANTNAASGINLNHVPAGIYFIKVASDKAQHTQKLIIQ